MAGKTALMRRTTAVVKRWCRGQKMEVLSLSHVHPRAYVVARVAPKCLIVSVATPDMEPHMREMSFANIATVHEFDDSLQSGDWCSSAYVSTPSSGQRVAIKVVS